MAPGKRNGSSKWGIDEEEKDQGATSAAVAVGMAAGVVGLAAWGMSKWLWSSEPESEREVKMMKAPGRDYYMPREDFVKDPATYFRNLRGKNDEPDSESESEPEPEPEPAHQEKMMKAPGRDYYMPRKDFVKDPATYFRNLRGKNYSEPEPEAEPATAYQEKMMKAPGRDYYMPRKVFEADPAAHFRSLRGKNYSEPEPEPEPEPAHQEKMMKAPGRDYYIPRKDFEADPAAHFRNLRINK